MKKIILLVEDEKAIQRLCRRLLQDPELVLVVVDRVGEALKIINSKRFNLLICDICLPDGNGLDVVEQFKHLQPESPAIVITGSPEQDSERRAWSLKAHAFLFKPFDINQFKAIVEHALVP